MPATRILAFVALLSAAALVSNCAVGPDFKPATPPEVDRYTREPLPAQTMSTSVAGGQAQRFVKDLDIPAEWWTLFHSPKLNGLIEQSLKANPNLQATMAALRIAQENVRAQEGKFLPLVQGNFNPTRQQSTNNALGTQLPLADGSTTNAFNVVTSQVIVSYTLDVWGQNRRAVESLQAQADSERFLVEAAYLTLTSNIALATIQEASLRDQITATQELINISARMLGVLHRQLSAGYSSRVDVAAQEAQLAQTIATLPPLQKQLAQQRDLIAALAGRFPSEEPLKTFTLSGFHLPRDLPVSLPSRLVEQRPDVRSAQELVHSASAQVGIAIANMLPNFTINATGGYTSTALANFADYFSPTNRFLTLAGNVTQPIFDGFSLLHQKRAAEAAYDQATSQYRTTVIGAVQNVADTLRALQADANALRAASIFERAAKTSLDLVRQQFDIGYANILLLLNAQQTYLQARIALIQTRANRLSDTVALFQALGGGWWNRADLTLSQAADDLNVKPE
jgi:NodT family efflux transporter outer membrane factor (OMF) lipoprotein